MYSRDEILAEIPVFTDIVERCALSIALYSYFFHMENMLAKVDKQTSVTEVQFTCSVELLT